MGKGACLCGAVSFSWEGEPIQKAVCHCRDCQHITGSAYSTNVIVPAADFKVQGTPKKYTSKADSGRAVTTVFCGECGSPLWREGEMTDPNAKIVRAGNIVDEGAMNSAKPLAELYVTGRADWVPESEGAHQMKGMPPA